MKKHFFLIILFIGGFTGFSFGQKYFSKTGRVHIVSEAPVEKIEADNNNGYVIFDAASGRFEFSVLIKGFTFQKALMQEHFNENYMESDDYPKAVYKGSIADWSTIHLMNDHVFQVNVEGQLTMHGVTKPFKCPASIIMKSGGVSATSSFDIAIADFNIQIPKVVKDNISKNVKVDVKVDLLPMK
ncbi:MAG: YceI family protein [Saprospiraceae bacterium]|uniref:YceI family protein n=1 Tax=Candidatus Opimibacter skivensis TaxID=2982028 RepID=A0A9D7XSK4_9BACT|nr:YceI family protein [Candidatus Opimibacter skivensis]